MKGIQGDIVVFALMVSAIVHFCVMFYAKPMVMVSVVPSSVRAVHRGPMRVVEAELPPAAMDLSMVEDILAEKAAPEAVGEHATVPPAESSLPAPNDGEVRKIDPGMLSPVSADEAPEVMSSPSGAFAHSTLDASAADVAPMPIEPGKALSRPNLSGGDPLLPSFALPALEGSRPPADAPDGASGMIAEHSKESSNFTPVPEVMDEVSEQVVEAEKKAVRALVDVSSAKDLSSVVDMRLSTFSSDGFSYFRVKVSPLAALKTVPKDLVVLIDASGSIGKERMNSIRKAAKDLLRSASNTGDRFNLVAFRDRFSYAFRSWMECTVSSFADADRWLDNVAPFGRTDVFATVASVLALPRDPARPLIALVVTDGDANEGVVATSEILSKFTALNDGLVSVYMYGVKSSANRELIDVLTRGNRGESFIFDGWRWKAGSGIEGLSEKFRDPLLSDLRVVFSSDCRAEAYPRLLKNLYRGGSVEIVGRVPSGTREVAFSLKGLNGKNAYESFFRLPLGGAAADPKLAEDWAAEHAIDMKLR